MAKTKVNLTALKKLLDGVPKEAALASNRAIAALLEKKMKDLISKGISPIEGDGRFPEYVGVSRNKRTESQIRELRKSATSRARDFGSKDESVRASRSLARRLKGELKSSYPDNVRSKFPNKRRRPVNLFLSGRFLRELKAIPKRINLIAVGFFSPYGQKLEQGHREQANGQGYRPIIPDTDAGEDFALSIKALILKAYRDSILAYLKKNK